MWSIVCLECSNGKVLVGGAILFHIYMTGGEIVAMARSCQPGQEVILNVYLLRLYTTS